MSLVTIQRSPTPPDSVDSSSLSQYDDSVSAINQSEDFFASKATAVLQNLIGRRRSSIITAGNTIQNGLMKALMLLRKEDSLGLIVSLERVNSKLEGLRYFCVILTSGKQDTEEYLILGVDICLNEATIGLVLPICQDMSVVLDGDGGFKVKNKDGEKLFKPSSVLALWSTVQLLNRACSIANQNNYYIGGLSHTWIGFYTSNITSNRAQIAEWNRMIYADTITNSNLAPKSAIGEFVLGTQVDESVTNKDEIRRHLKDIMRVEDMDNVTVVFLREKLQERLSFNLKEYRSFIAEEILIIYGQMDCASKILPYLYLGSTYNASNLDELLSNNITHIINVTKESENFFRERFVYRNVEVFDLDDTNLLNYFNGCYQFINEAKYQQSACLVHCQRGISRSASVVIAYMMKEFGLSRDKALKEVKCKRECILPNDGFMAQLKIYEGILQASAHRHNHQFQGDNRSNVKSMPNELYQIPEKDIVIECPNTAARQRQATSQYDQLLSDVINTPSTHTASLSLIDYTSEGIVEESSLKPPKIDLQEDLLMYKSINIDIDPSDCLLEADDVSMRLQRNESVKRLLRLKGDASWIKGATGGGGGEHQHIMLNRADGCHSYLIEDNCNDTMEQCTRKCHSVQIESVLDDDIDHQSQRPVKELLTKYSNIDN